MRLATSSAADLYLHSAGETSPPRKRLFKLGLRRNRQIVDEYIVTLFGGIQQRNLLPLRSPSRDSFMRGPLQHCRTVTVSGGCDLSGRKEFHSLLRPYLREAGG
ncbi:hypothetical protein QTP88_014273 [Uroleucon formosanum]